MRWYGILILLPLCCLLALCCCVMSRVSSHFFFFCNIYFPSPFASFECGAVFLQRNTCYWAEPAHEDATLWYGTGSRSCILYIDALLGGARRRNSKRAEAQWGVNRMSLTSAPGGLHRITRASRFAGFALVCLHFSCAVIFRISLLAAFALTSIHVFPGSFRLRFPRLVSFCCFATGRPSAASCRARRRCTCLGSF